MSALSSTVRSYPVLGRLPIFDELSTPGEALTVGLLFRHCDRQQEIDWNAKRAGDLLMQGDGTFAFTRLQVRQIALRDADPDDEFDLSHLTPLPQHTDGIISRRQPIDHHLGQNDLLTAGYCSARATDDSRSTGILAGRQRNESIVFALRKNGEFFAFGGFDELNLVHDGLSTVNLSSMPDCRDDDRPVLDIKHDSPIADPQARSIAPLEALHVALPGPRQGLKLGIEPSADIGGQIEPLTRSRRGEGDFHAKCIAYRNSSVNMFIANCDEERRA